MMRWRSAATRVSVVASLGFLRSSISTVDLSLIVCALFLAAQAAARAPRRRFNVCWPGPGSGSATCRHLRAARDSGIIWTPSDDATAWLRHRWKFCDLTDLTLEYH